METDKLAKRETPPSFIERLIERADGLEDVKKVGMVIIESGFCPEHFRTTKDAVGVVMCIEAGKQLGLTWMQSLSDLYPVKGRIGMMGSLARALIFSSTVLDRWEEIIEGTYPEDDYKHIIISKRKGLPGEFRSEFSVYDAKKAGLFQKDIYQRYGKRLIMWRNIGFHATDYYGDIMKGMKTVEELNDYDGIVPGTEKVTITTESGKELIVNEKDKKHSGKLTERAAEKIKYSEFAPIQDAKVIDDTVNVPDPADYKADVADKAEESPFIPSSGSVEYMDGKEISRTDVPGKEGDLTLAVMEKMETKDLLAIINKDTDTIEALELIPGKNTNKKLRSIIHAHQNNRLAEYVAEELAKVGKEGQEPTFVPVTPEEIMKGEIPINRAFDQMKPDTQVDNFLDDPVKKAVSTNKYGIEIPELVGEGRDFSFVKKIFNATLNITPPLDSAKYNELAGKAGLLGAFPDREVFFKKATAKAINDLLNQN